MSNEEKYLGWLPRGIDFWHREFDEILEDHSKSRDQQIKELTVLLEQCEVLAFQDDAEDYIERWQEYTSKVSQYRQKYPKP